MPTVVYLSGNERTLHGCASVNEVQFRLCGEPPYFLPEEVILIDYASGKQVKEGEVDKVYVLFRRCDRSPEALSRALTLFADSREESGARRCAAELLLLHPHRAPNIFCVNAWDGNVAVVKAFLAEGIDVNSTDGTAARRTALWVCTRQNHPELVQVLLHASAEVDHASCGGQTPLYTSSERGYIDVVKVLLSANANVDRAESSGLTPLMGSCWNGHVDVVTELIGAKANVNLGRINGETPLYLSAWEGHVDVVKTLLQAGADISQAHKWVSTLLSLSYSGVRHVHVAKILDDAGARCGQCSQRCRNMKECFKGSVAYREETEPSMA